MAMFKDILTSNESLFTNDMALDVEYTPPIIKFRENQQQYVATCIKPLLLKRNGKNLFVTGKPGIGKTVAVKHILNELNKETDEVNTIYINCWKKNTAFKVVNDMCEQLGYKWAYNKRTEEILAEVLRLINKKSAVVVLDEVDKLEDQDLIYTLLEDIYRRSLILITNYEDCLEKIDSRIISRLTPETLKFNAYNKIETKEILKQRVFYAFVKDAWNEGAFNLIAEKTFELSDIRLGLFLLKEAGLIAESESSKTVNLKHAEKAISKLADFKIRNNSELTEEENKILDLIKDNSGRSATEIYDAYNKVGDKTYRTFYRKLKDLEKAKLISIEEVEKEHGGKRSIINYGYTKRLNEF